MLDITGTLLMVNECRARVRIDQPQQLVEFTGPDGTTRTFRASRNHETSWAPTVVVEALSFEPLHERDTTMATKKTTKKDPAKKATKATAKTPRAAKADGKPSQGKLSQLDAAVKVLTEAGEPMTTKAMIEAMAAKGYWTSPGGATPAQTLYSAILRDLQKHGKEARFIKVDRGQFALNTGKAPTAKPAAKADTKAKRGDEDHRQEDRQEGGRQARGRDARSQGGLRTLQGLRCRHDERQPTAGGCHPPRRRLGAEGDRRRLPLAGD
ncbi:MAG: winged helix-turn-helix domain-containing protein [Planctomycetaceae bacterium]